MQFNSKRILAVLGLLVSLRVVKDGRWQEKTATNTETGGFSSQPANNSPARDPSNCTDPKLPVTRSSFHPHFPDVPREVPLQTPGATVLFPQPHLQKCLLQFPSSERVPDGGAALCFPTDLTRITSSPSPGALIGSTMPKITDRACYAKQLCAQLSVMH